MIANEVVERTGVESSHGFPGDKCRRPADAWRSFSFLIARGKCDVDSLGVESVSVENDKGQSHR